MLCVFVAHLSVVVQECYAQCTPQCVHRCRSGKDTAFTASCMVVSEEAAMAESL